MKRWKWAAVAVGTAVFLAGCGGASDGADTAPKATAAAFKVFGDSIVDSGTFGYKFTIQGKDSNGNDFKIFPELVAANLGVSSLCPFFGPTLAPSTKTGCTSYGVGGGRVNNLTNAGAPSNSVPFSITYQMDVAAAGLTSTDVVLVDGGGNDLADLTGAYLGATTPAGVGNFLALAGTLLPQATIGAILGTAGPTPTTLGNVAGAYAQAVGKTLAAAVKTKILAKGVTKVIVVNSPDITATPRFLAVLAGIEASAGSAQRAGIQGAVGAWTAAFNGALAADLAGTSVQLFDLNAEGAKIVATPAQFAFTNITTPACPKVAGGLDSVTGQASLSAAATVAACNSALMSAPSGIPVGETTADWWQHYAYSDNFHPTPALHKLIGQAINLQLVKAGWL